MPPPPATAPASGASSTERQWVLNEGVLQEPSSGTSRLALWLPENPNGAVRHWERISCSAQPDFMVAAGVCAATATAIRVRQLPGGLFTKMFRRWRGGGERTWSIPNGETAEQEGERRNDFLVVWTENGAGPLDEARLKSRWPAIQKIRPIGRDLYLISGVDLSGTQPRLETATESPRLVAERLLAAARVAEDRQREASALADLGAVYLHEGNADQAIGSLQEALAITKQLGDRTKQGDILGNLGLINLKAGQFARALELFGQELALAREGGDRFAEKMALERLGLAHGLVGQPAQALRAFGLALALARTLGHRKHEADLLWYLAIQHADLGQRNQALDEGEAAVALMEKMRNPQAAAFAEHLAKYRQGETGAELGGSQQLQAPGSPEAFLGDSVVADIWSASAGGQPGQPPATGPVSLRMALSAARSMAKFVGTGFKTVPPDTLRRRLQTCAVCEHHTGLRCRLCGCFTNAKARMDHEECPIGKWVV